MAKTKVQDPPGPLRTERLPSGMRKLIRKLVVELEDGTRFTVPDGFETDFSSIPALARCFIDWSKVDIAGVVHDFLYWCPQKDIGRKRADHIWREIAGAGEHHANWLQQWLGWAGLLAGGWYAFRRARKAREDGHGRNCEPVHVARRDRRRGLGRGSE